jgi:phenylalanyl-tRNA synthetase alpha chain
VRPDAEAYATAGSPEAQVFAAVPPEGVTLAALKAALPGDVADLGFRQAMQQK